MKKKGGRREDEGGKWRGGCRVGGRAVEMMKDDM